METRMQNEGLHPAAMMCTGPIPDVKEPPDSL